MSESFASRIRRVRRPLALIVASWVVIGAVILLAMSGAVPSVLPPVSTPPVSASFAPLMPPTFNITLQNRTPVFENETYDVGTGGHSGNGTDTDVLGFRILRDDPINVTMSFTATFHQSFPLFFASWFSATPGGSPPLGGSSDSVLHVPVPAFGVSLVFLYLVIDPIYSSIPLGVLSLWAGSVSVSPSLSPAISIGAGFR